MQKVYQIDNIDCANCAAKMERKMAQVPGVEEVILTFATKQLRVTAKDPDSLIPQLIEACNSVESGVVITERNRQRKNGNSGTTQEAHIHEHKHEHHHGDECSCGREHDHESHEHHHEHHHEYHHEHHHDDACSCGCEHEHEHHHEHHHDDEYSCGCEHDHEHHEHEHRHEHHHDDECSCGCEHDHEHHHAHHHEHYHEHQHEDECSCGCEHDHEHHHDDECSCDCEHDHEHEQHEEHHEHHHEHHAISANCEKRVYLLENLGCANCAAKMERRINELPGVEDATITFATKQLRLAANHQEELLPQIQAICSSIESEVIVKEKISTQSPAKKGLTENQKTLFGVGMGAVLFIAGEILEHMGLEIPAIAVLVVAYIILGGKVVLTALKNMTKGQIFDENFLMSIATLGAFAIKEWPEAVGVMLFYRIGEFFEHIAVEKSRTQIMEAADLRPEVVNLVSGNDIRIIDAEEANVGDILLVRPGDRIPLDGIVVEGESRIDTSPVTGEPVPVKVQPGENVTSGCVNTSGLLKIRVEKVLEESMVTRILDSVENAAASKPKIDRFITRFARIYTPVVVLIAAITAIVPSLISGNWNYWVYTALSFLVMSCPCALVLSVPLAFFSGIGAGSKRGILFKGGVSLEAMTNVKAVIMDKTGTITEGNFVVQATNPVRNATEDELLSLAASCELTSTHPIGASIIEAAKNKGLHPVRPSSVEEIAGHGIRAFVDGKELLCGNRKLMTKYHIALDNYNSGSFGTEVLVAKDGMYIGHIVIADTIKSDAQKAIAAIRNMNITTAMLTGDGETSANAVAKETGIDEVHAKLLPQDKLSELKSIRQKYGAVMFVGDGINDAPVLAGADVGAAMGSGADAAIEAADVVFMTSSVEAIPQSLTIARKATRIAWQNVVFALIIKIAVMILGLCGYASMWLAVFADTGVAMLCVLNSIRILYSRHI